MSFPSDLEQFFRSILERADPTYRHQTYQALALAWYQAKESLRISSHGHDRDELAHDMNAEHNSCITSPPVNIRQAPCGVSAGDDMTESMSFVDFWLIRQSPRGLTDPDFPYKLKTRVVEEHESRAMAQQTSVFLGAACKDLLCFPRFKKEQALQAFDNIDRVEFLHRTVFSFLCTPEMQRVLADGIPEHFRNGRIWHLLNLARRKIQFETGYESYWLSHSLHTSLTIAHTDLHDRYVNEFERLILDRRGRRPDWYPELEIVATGVAFKQHGLLTKMAWDSTWLVSRLVVSKPNLQPLWTAALGESPLNRFPIDDVDHDVLCAVFRLTKTAADLLATKMTGKDADIAMLVLNYDVLCCYQSLWQLFLRKWALASPPRNGCLCPMTEDGHYKHHNDNCPRSLKWYSIWTLASRLIKSGANVDDRFCDAGKSVMDGSHSHRHMSAIDMIRDHVPRDWSVNVIGKGTSQRIKGWEEQLGLAETTLAAMLGGDDGAIG